MKKQFINPQNIIEVVLLEPYKNSGESWDTTLSHKWKLRFVTNTVANDFPYIIDHEYETKEECEEVLSRMNLICL